MWSVLAEFLEPGFQLRLSSSIGMAAIQCLVAIWVATSRTYWFWRALVLWAAVTMMVPIHAWELVWLFGTSSPLIIGGLWTGQWLVRKRNSETAIACEPPAIRSTAGKWRFSL